MGGRNTNCSMRQPCHRAFEKMSKRERERLLVRSELAEVDPSLLSVSVLFLLLLYLVVYYGAVYSFIRSLMLLSECLFFQEMQRHGTRHFHIIVVPTFTRHERYAVNDAFVDDCIIPIQCTVLRYGSCILIVATR